VSVRLLQGDALELAADLEPGSIHSIISSPPYWRARVYGDDPRQIGREVLHPDSFVGLLADIFVALLSALTDDGVIAVNVGNTYAGGGYGATSKLASKRRSWEGTMRDRGRRKAPFGYREGDLILIGPLLVAALRQRCDLFVRAEIIWHKPSAGEPPTIVDRPPKRHELIYILSKTKQARLRDPGEDWWKSDVWTISPGGDQGPSTAAMPEELARRLVLVSTRPGETILDPFAGGGTTLLAADRLGRNGIGFELMGDMVTAARARLFEDAPLFASGDVWPPHSNGVMQEEVTP
jgi:DNA modification methylase